MPNGDRPAPKHAFLIRLTPDEFAVLLALQAHWHCASQVETIRRALIDSARNEGLLVDPSLNALPAGLARRLQRIPE